jgi:SAM-dependent methyltransferase
MHEILGNLPSNSFVLDLGCARGSFTPTSTLATIVRFDRDVPTAIPGGIAAKGDAARLPFADASMAAVIANHSLEHFEDLQGCLGEIGRVISPGGALFVAVPDASTFTDKLYRWLANGGGHVNAFVAPEQVERAIVQATGLEHVATRTLCSSLSFLNRFNAPKPGPRRLLLIGGGSDCSLLLYTWLSRRIDRLLGLRTSIYGWAFYFGNIPTPIDTAISLNVCIRCGSGVTGALLKERNRVRTTWYFLRTYTCPYCGAFNIFSDDRHTA